MVIFRRRARELIRPTVYKPPGSNETIGRSGLRCSIGTWGRESFGATIQPNEAGACFFRERCRRSHLRSKRLLSSTFALAQTSQNTDGVTPNTGGVTNPSTPSNNSTVGAPPRPSNPSNSQDISGKGNPQDLTRPGASNPQDLKR